ncbi:MAG: ParB/RepB/Spo0J family partition protein [Pseudomonadota bacterium]
MSETRGLGRGLSSLISEPNQARPRDGLRQVPVGDLRPGRFQPRTNFDDEEIAHLADSLRNQGMLQPILARPVLAGSDGDLEIVAGERRWRAAQIAMLHDVPVIVREFSDIEVLEIALIENLQRADLDPLEEAAAYKRLGDEFGLSQNDIAEAVGRSRPHVANMIRLLDLPGAVQAMLDEGRLSAGHARALLGADEPTELAEIVIDKGLNVRQTEALVRAGGVEIEDAEEPPAPVATPAAPRASGPVDPNTLDLERRLSDALGLKVEVRGSGEKGRLVVHYTTVEQLDDVITKLESPSRPRLVGS